MARQAASSRTARSTGTASAAITRRLTGANAVPVDIDLTEPNSDALVQFGSPDRGWLESSRDLLRGLQVRETPMDSLPADLVKALTKPKR
jgi:hypothetical protein